MLLPILIILAITIIVVLSVIAWNLHAKLRQQQKQHQEKVAQITEQRQKHRDYLNNSIQVLAQGLIDDQLTLTEGAIRISVLLDNLHISNQEKEEFSAFFQLADATSHIPILEAWKKLSSKQQFQYDKERSEIEAQYNEFIIDAAKRLKSRHF